MLQARHIKTALRKSPVLFLIGFSLLMGGLAVLRYTHNHNKPNPLAGAPTNLYEVGSVANLLDGYWQMPGAKQENGSLAIRDIHYGIVAQDGKPAYDNPPVNLYGTYVEQHGSFVIQVRLAEVKGAAELSLYGQPPIVEDEYRVDPATVTIHIEGTAVTVSTSHMDADGKIHTTKDAQAIADSTDHVITIAVQGKAATVAVDNFAQQEISTTGIFDSGKLWFGARASGSSFRISQLTINGLDNASIALHDPRSEFAIRGDSSGLSAVAQGKRPGMSIGTALALGPLVGNGTYLSLAGNFNSYTIENALKFQFVHPLPGNESSSYDFHDADALVSIARAANAKIHGHALVFGEANPAWVQDIAAQHPDQLHDVMIGHVTNVVSHYKGQVSSWDVINEPLADYDTPAGQDGLRKHIWYKAMGSSYIADALNAAHDADPGAELWINEFGLETDSDRFADMLALVKQLKANNVPLTGIGFQSHITEGDMKSNGQFNSETLRDHIKQLAELGLKVRISELDVEDASQFPAYGQIASVCMSEPTCVSITTWGISDAFSSGGSIQGSAYTTGIGLPWDKNFQPTPALASLKTAL